MGIKISPQPFKDRSREKRAHVAGRGVAEDGGEGGRGGGVGLGGELGTQGKAT